MTEKQQEIWEKIKVLGIENNCYAVARWIWAEFSNKPSDEIITKLKELKFRWSPKRKAWQNACGCWAGGNRKIDPRLKYGIQKIDETLLT